MFKQFPQGVQCQICPAVAVTLDFRLTQKSKCYKEPASDYSGQIWSLVSGKIILSLSH